jgi:hypothetical protein
MMGWNGSLTLPRRERTCFKVDQGWGPLCKFLGDPVPESKFPNVNDRPEIMKTIHEITRGAYVILGVGVAGFAGLAYGAFRFFSG